MFNQNELLLWFALKYNHYKRKYVSMFLKTSYQYTHKTCIVKQLDVCIKSLTLQYDENWSYLAYD